MKLAGIIQDGFQKAQSFLGLPAYQERLLNHLGFLPFSGTLNLAVNETDWKQIMQFAHKKTESDFVQNNRLLGGFDLYKIGLVDHSIGAIIVPHKTRHGPQIVEIVAPFSIKRKFNLKKGSHFSIILE